MKTNRTNRRHTGRRVLFTGYHGQSNTGDDAFCAVASWGAKRYWKTDDIRFLSRNLPVLPVTARPLLSENRLFRGQGLIQTIIGLAGRQTIVFAGGSIFHRTGSQLSTKSLVSKSHTIWPNRLGAIGVSIGPFSSSRDEKHVKKLLSKFSFLSLRDKRSYEQACSMNLPYNPVEAFDLAVLLPDIYGGTPVCPETPVLGVSLCHYERYISGDIQNEKRRESQLVETLRILAKDSTVTIRFLVFNGSRIHGDSELTARVAKRIADHARTEIVEYSRDPSNMWHAIGECSAVLATRLHAGIFSCIAQVPFLQVEYHQKCTDFLDDILYPQEMRIGDIETSPVKIASMLLTMINNETQGQCLDINSIKEKARRNFSSIDF